MIRPREHSDSIRAGVLAFSVHVLLLGVLLISFDWKNSHPSTIAQVELWESLPSEVIKPTPMPPEPPVEPMVKPTVKPIPQPVEPKPVVEAPQPKVDIAVEKKPTKPVKEKTPKPDDALAALQKELMQDELKKPNKKPDENALKKLQQQALSEDASAGEQKNLAAQAAANAGIVDEYKQKIQIKIRNHVNKTLCGDAHPELKFEIGLLPTGELNGSPKLTKNSGNPACDEAVERAIRAAEPLPLPADKTLFPQFKNLKLTFRPNDE